jgi:acetyl-CoA synthetase
VGGLFDSLLAPWSHGMPVVAIERSRFDPERALAQMADYGIRNAFLPPTALKLLRQVPRIGERFALRMRSVHCGGESLSPDVLSWGAETFGSVAEIYGMTEVGFVVGNCPELMPIRPGSMGKAYPGHRVGIVDEAGREQPPGTVGEVGVHRSDPGMFLGYWHDEAGTRAKQAGAWFLSGDLAEQDESGYLWYRARKDDVIISAGYRFGPTEIENAILKHEAVRDVAVVATPDPMRGQVAKAFVVLREGETPSEAHGEEIRTLVKSRLGAHEYPREIEFVSELPRTSTGKVARAELRRLEQERKRAG